ncbi:hypothetical protein ElyMa_005490100 [Elysia marginata]|uniref:Uncharacterized protein n=1 Tax=Elysia marginata TaxID=1093978 RepID=A0AAV4ESR1_9GAST|nr:hypothetical protein ElyMa_005490100 [Elysia marginata]
MFWYIVLDVKHYKGRKGGRERGKENIWDNKGQTRNKISKRANHDVIIMPESNQWSSCTKTHCASRAYALFQAKPERYATQRDARGSRGTLPRRRTRSKPATYPLGHILRPREKNQRIDQ